LSEYTVVSQAACKSEAAGVPPAAFENPRKTATDLLNGAESSQVWLGIGCNFRHVDCALRAYNCGSFDVSLALGVRLGVSRSLQSDFERSQSCRIGP
jgi:hypothetical protein